MSSTNVQKTPFAQTMNDAMRQRTRNGLITQIGRSLPCSVVKVVSSGIVTVKFEIDSGPFTLPQVTMPIMGPEYIRYPIQPGCKGRAVSADAYLGQMSGLGSGTATLASPPNLSALTFMPIGNTGWSDVDPEVLTLYGPNGVTLRDQGNNASVVITTNSVTLSAGGHTVVINSSGVTIDGRVFLTHEHTGVSTGAGHTGGVV